MKFPSHMFFREINHGYRTAIIKKYFLCLLSFHMAAATYFYYEKVRRTMRTATVSYLLNDCFQIEPLIYILESLDGCLTIIEFIHKN